VQPITSVSQGARCRRQRIAKPRLGVSDNGQPHQSRDRFELRNDSTVWVRITHWINALAVVLMVMSGWQVYDASLIFPVLRFPSAITLGGWLGAALLWHFAVMWLLFVNFLVYLGLNLVSGRLRRKLPPISFRSLTTDLVAALRGKLGHKDLSRYNAVQKFAYLVVIVDIALQSDSRAALQSILPRRVFCLLCHILARLSAWVSTIGIIRARRPLKRRPIRLSLHVSRPV
jgi:Ni,Fe-hydrogenase I cytochrome b subunit